MKIRKKPIIISVLSLVLCLSLVIGIAYRMPITAHAVEVTATMSGMTSAGGGVSQIGDNKYAFNDGAQIQIVGWYGEWDDHPQPWVMASNTWWNSAVSTYNATNGKWKTEPYMRWQNGEDLQHNFLAYWPTTLADSNSNLTNVPVALTGSPEDDILLAKWSGKRPDDNVLNLQFNHLMARFDVHLLFRNEYTTYSDISIETNLRNTVQCNLLTGEVDAESASGNYVEMYENQHSNGNYHWSGTCITVPHEFDDGTLLTIKFIGNGEEKTLNYEHTGQLNFESGKRTTLTLVVGKDKVELANTFVSDWEIAPEINAGEAEECMHVTYDANNNCTVCGKKKEDGQ